MPTRAVLFRLMLWVLGLAAATGVLAVLFQGGTLVGRVVATGFVTAAGCGLFIPTSALIDREHTRTAGLLGMSVIIVEFLVALGLIWELVQALLPGTVDVEVNCMGSLVLIGLATPVCMRAICVGRGTPHRIAAVASILATCLALASSLTAIWWPTFRSYRAVWWETCGTLLVFGALIAVTLAHLSRETRRPWRWLGIAADLGACVMSLQHIWVGTESELGFVIFWGLIAIGSVVAHANLCLGLALRAAQHWVRQGTILFAAVAAGLAVLVIAKDKFPWLPIQSDLFGRFAASAGIVAGCGTLALLVLTRMHRTVDVEPDSYVLSKIRLICPRCRRKQALGVGDSVCASCGLRISIRVEEPRCVQCSYLLRGLRSDRCPECGTEIALKVGG